MIEIHHIHDEKNSYILKILTKEFSLIENTDIVKNYHPDYSTTPGNFFFILKSGRYNYEKGKYYILLDGDEFIASAGWNEYDYDCDLALVLTRAYVKRQHRSKFYLGKNILPLTINDTIKYKKTWMTVNEYNINVYNWINRSQDKSIGSWPEIYKNFRTIGIKNIYYTDQYIMEYIR